MDSNVSSQFAPHDNVDNTQSNIILRRDYGKELQLTSNCSKDDRDDAKRLKRCHSQRNTVVSTNSSMMDTSSASQPALPLVLSQNPYDTLSAVDPEGNVNNADCQLPASTTKKRRRPPPITIVNKGTKHSREILNSANIPQTGYQVKSVKSGTQLITTDQDVFDAAINVLRDTQTEFFTFTPSHKQQIRFILSGLPLYDLAELKEELELKGVQPADLKMFSKKKIGPEESVLYLLYFEKGSIKMSELQGVKALFNTMVKWRFFTRKPNDTVQCHRCQQFGHGMRFCNVSPLCVKCGEKHFTNQCKIPSKAHLNDASATRNEIRCANCSANHTANYRGCPSRANYIKQLEETRRRTSKHTISNTPRTASIAQRNLIRNAPTVKPYHNNASVIDGLSFSQAVQGSQTVESSNPNLFSITEFLCLARELFRRLQGCRTKEQQFLALSELIMKYVYNG